MSSQSTTQDLDPLAIIREKAKATNLSEADLQNTAQWVSERLDFRRWIGTCSRPDVSDTTKQEVASSIQKNVKKELVNCPASGQIATAVSEVYHLLAASQNAVTFTDYLQEGCLRRLDRNQGKEGLDIELLDELGGLRTCVDTLGLDDFADDLDDYVRHVLEGLRQDQQDSEKTLRHPVGPWETSTFVKESVIHDWLDKSLLVPNSCSSRAQNADIPTIVSSIIDGQPTHSMKASRSDFDNALCAQDKRFIPYIDKLQEGDSEGDESDEEATEMAL